MDTGSGNRKEAKEIAMRLFGKENLTFEDIRSWMRQTQQNTLQNIDSVINSRWTWWNKKYYLRLFRSLIEFNAVNENTILDLWENVNYLTEVALLLGKEIEKNLTTTKELEDALWKVKTATAPIARVTQIMEKLDKKLREEEERKQKGDRLSEAYRV